MDKRIEICKWWIELDDRIGMQYEFCRAVHSRCTCSATEEQCNYSGYYKRSEGV